MGIYLTYGEAEKKLKECESYHLNEIGQPITLSIREQKTGIDLWLTSRGPATYTIKD
jgi:hypothetical protein